MKRIGAKKKPIYRIVVTDRRTRRDGAAIEEIGYYNPRANLDKGQEAVKLDVEAARKWLATGAQPSDTVRGIFNRAQVYIPAEPVSDEPQ